MTLYKQNKMICNFSMKMYFHAILLDKIFHNKKDMEFLKNHQMKFDQNIYIQL